MISSRELIEIVFFMELWISLDVRGRLSKKVILKSTLQYCRWISWIGWEVKCGAVRANWCSFAWAWRPRCNSNSLFILQPLDLFCVTALFNALPTARHSSTVLRLSTIPCAYFSLPLSFLSYLVSPFPSSTFCFHFSWTTCSAWVSIAFGNGWQSPGAGI